MIETTEFHQTMCTHHRLRDERCPECASDWAFRAQCLDLAETLPNNLKIFEGQPMDPDNIDDKPVTPKQIWTPDKKVPDAVRKMAWLLFLEEFKDALKADHEDFDTAEIYRYCLGVAQAVYDIDLEKNPQT